jgi:hypothetical protein
MLLHSRMQKQLRSLQSRTLLLLRRALRHKSIFYFHKLYQLTPLCHYTIYPPLCNTVINICNHSIKAFHSSPSVTLLTILDRIDSKSTTFLLLRNHVIRWCLFRGFFLWVFRLYTAPMLCSSLTGLCSSCAET